MKKLSHMSSLAPARRAAGIVSAAALMLGASHAATVGFNFQVDYCGTPSYAGSVVTAPAFGIGVSRWESLTQMKTGYGADPACTNHTYSLSQTVDTTTSTGGLNPLPNGSLSLNWSAACANSSGFNGYGIPFGGNGYHPGEQQVYWGFLRDGVNFGPGSSGGDNNEIGYSIDIVGLKTLFTNTPFVIQLIASGDSMNALTNAFVINATLSSTQSVTYPNPGHTGGDQGGAPWKRYIGGGLSTVSSSLNNDHMKIIGNRAAHGGDKSVPDDFNNGSSIAGFIITDKPVVTMSPQPVNAAAHDDVTLRAIAAGVPPLSYQWRLAGVPVGGATNSSYSIPNIAFSRNYDLVVTNLYGSATSSVSTVTVDRLLVTAGPGPGTNVISWAVADGVLQACGTVNGTYTNVVDSLNVPASSPYTNSVKGARQFFRYVHVQTAINSNPFDM